MSECCYVLEAPEEDVGVKVSPLLKVSPLPRCGIMIYKSCPLYSWQALSPA